MPRLTSRTNGWPTLAFVVFLLSIALPTNASAAEKKVLFIYGDKSTGAASVFRQVAATNLRSGSTDRITIFEEFTDLAQFSSAKYQSLLSSFFRNKFSGRRFDLVVATSPGVLDFLLNPDNMLFTGVPVVFAAIDRDYLEGMNKHLPPTVTGILVDLGFSGTLEAALKMQPDVERVVVVGGTSETDAQYLAKARREFAQYEGRVEFTYLTDLPMEDLEKRLAGLPTRTIVIFVPFFHDGAGQVFAPIEGMVRIAGASSVPVYSVVSAYADVGAVGGFVWNVEAEAREVSKLAQRVLSGENPAHIPVRVGDTNRYMFDWRQLKRWGIDRQRLPPGSILLHEEFSVWEQYKWRIVAVASLCLFQGLLIVGLLITLRKRRTDITERKQAELSLQNLTGRLLTLQDQEQQRVAAELHDGLGQSLAIIKNRALLALREPPNHDAALQQLQEISATATAAIHEVREIAHNLRPYELHRLGLVAAINSMVQRVSSSTSIDISSALEEIDGVFSPAAETSIYRIIQEGLNNVIKHSQATVARIEINRTGTQLTISVEDNGMGIPQSAPPNKDIQAAGFGLAGIAERVRGLGGSLSIDSQPERGTTLRVRLRSPDATS